LAYIGTIPAEAYTSFAVQHFTTSATDTFTLDFPVANENEIALFINNVRQEPGSGYAYTASGTTLTLSSAITGSDSMYCVFIGKAVQTVTPATGSVTLDMLSATGTKSSSTFLRGDNSFATVPTGVSLVDMQVITTTSTYTPTSGTQFVKVYCVGAGGGGGGAEATTSGSSNQAIGGGGGGGGTAIRTYNSTELGATAAITIGSGGTGGTGFADGTDGGDTTFNPVGTGVTLTGGGGKKGLTIKTAGRQRAYCTGGGSATNGQINIGGRIDPVGVEGSFVSIRGDHTGSEGTGFFYEIPTGAGGGSFLSSDGALVQKIRQSTTGGTIETINGSNGVNGTGGDGGYVGFQIDTANGGDGGDGMVVIEEYA
jgi:hypothetical protein